MLSGLLILRNYGNLTFYGDEESAFFFKDVLKMPYTKVFSSLDSLKGIPPGMWAAGKIYVYGMQTEPFFHVDNDFYIWKRLPERIFYEDIVVQDSEVEENFLYFWNSVYRKAVEFSQSHLKLPPSWIKDLNTPEYKKKAYNMGFFGGKRLDAINRYCSESLSFINDNLEIFRTIKNDDLNEINIVAEQYIIYTVLKDMKIVPYKLLPSVKDRENSFLISSMGFNHLLGTAKQRPENNIGIENKLKTLFPENYKIAQEVFKKFKIQ